jgi:hypothetical protein
MDVPLFTEVGEIEVSDVAAINDDGDRTGRVGPY